MLLKIKNKIKYEDTFIINIIETIPDLLIFECENGNFIHFKDLPLALQQAILDGYPEAFT